MHGLSLSLMGCGVVVYSILDVMSHPLFDHVGRLQQQALCGTFRRLRTQEWAFGLQQRVFRGWWGVAVARNARRSGRKLRRPFRRSTYHNHSSPSPCPKFCTYNVEKERIAAAIKTSAPGESLLDSYDRVTFFYS